MTNEERGSSPLGTESREAQHPLLGMEWKAEWTSYNPSEIEGI